MRAELEKERQALKAEFVDQHQKLADQQVRNQLTLERTESANLEVSCVPARSSPAWRGRSRPT